VEIEWRAPQGTSDGLPLVAVFTETFLMQRANDVPPEGGQVLSLAPDTIFPASAVVDWAKRDRAPAYAARAN
jgi:hypothetical protein